MTPDNLSREEIYWKVVLTLRIKEEAVEWGSENKQEPKKAQQARMPLGHAQEWSGRDAPVSITGDGQLLLVVLLPPYTTR